MYIVTIKRAYVNTAAVENQPVLNIANVSVVFSYPACKSQAPYYSHLSPVRLYHIFPHYLRKKKVIEHKMCINLVYNFRLKNLSF